MDLFIDERAKRDNKKSTECTLGRQFHEIVMEFDNNILPGEGDKELLLLLGGGVEGDLKPSL